MSSVEAKSSVVTRQVFGMQQRFPYSPCYCEENVYLLASDLVRRGFIASIDKVFAVFIINPSKKIAMWKQRAGLVHKGRSRRRKQQQQQHRKGHDGDVDDSGEGCSTSGEDSDRESGSGMSSRVESEGDREADEDVNNDDVEGLVVWDYHVVLVQMPSGQAARGQQDSAGPGLAVGTAPEGSTPPNSAVAAGQGGQAEARAAPGMVLQTAFAALDNGGPSKDGRCGGDMAAAIAAGVSAPGRSGALVWDLDTLLPFPCSLELYAQRALKSHYHLVPHYQRFFRVVPASAYLYHFASDRSHMRLEGGDWRMPPPPYPPIIAADGATNNIHFYWDVTKRNPEGESGLDEFLQAVSITPQHGPDPAAAAVHNGSQGAAGAECHPKVMGGLGRKSAQPYGIVLDEQSFLRAFGVPADGGSVEAAELS
ncbi:hypothetical protein VaNZ11_014000 [Volvox africanus]|uniref:Protein N-terminal glutamine amidohydrolase n=1 Tax=Volvox africanus TaxID=51714 RepID=A0ABQ5SJ62_9CHLO|nr:hypothetical protein VaNZ11_014000 [Volvox africanus]